MKTYFYFLFLLCGCSLPLKEKPTDKEPVESVAYNHRQEKPDYDQLISAYLQEKDIEPTLIFNNDGRESTQLLTYRIAWKEKGSGLEIKINGKTISTASKVTLNRVWGEIKDSVNFANQVFQIKIYQPDSLIGFILENAPCTGLGCSVHYQLIYDLKTGRESYFGTFRTEYDLNLYDFNRDGTVDYLSKTFNGRNPSLIDTTTYEMYSQQKRGQFERFSDLESNRYWFRHIYSEEDSLTDTFEEQWITRIIKTP